MTVLPIPLPNVLRIADDHDIILHPRPITRLLYPPREHGMSHEPLEVHVKPVHAEKSNMSATIQDEGAIAAYA